MMKYFYNINDELMYIPVHLSLVIKHRSFNIDILEKSITSCLYKFIEESDKKYFILNFENIEYYQSRAFEIFKSILQENRKNLIFINIKKEMKSKILDNDLKSINLLNGIGDESFCLENAISTNKGLLYYNNLENQYEGQAIEKIKQQIFLNCLETKELDEMKYLQSSNVYINKYVDIKRVFKNTKVFPLLIYELCNVINNHFGDSFDKVVCSSYNSSAIANLVAILLDKEVLNFIKIGPQLTIKDKKIINMIKPSEKYLYIYDFICMGTEYKIVKSMVVIKESKLVGAVGVAKYILPNRKTKDDKIFSLVDINKDNFNYIVKIHNN